MSKYIKYQIKVMQAFDEGKPIEFCRVGYERWAKSLHPLWDWYHYRYRIMIVPDQIPWEHIIPEIKYIYRDGVGDYWGSCIMPQLSSSGNMPYYSVKNSSVNEMKLVGIVIIKGTLPNWESLSIRPGIEENDIPE